MGLQAHVIAMELTIINMPTSPKAKEVSNLLVLNPILNRKETDMQGEFSDPLATILELVTMLIIIITI